MAEAPIGMWEMQLAFAIGLLGIYAGWRGTIAKMTGFYDLSGAVRTLLFGLVAGVIAASVIDLMVLRSIREGTANILSVSLIAMIIAMAESAFALFILGRPNTVGLRASPPYGWTLGLGFGAMRSAHLNVRLFDPDVWQGTTGFGIANMIFGCLLTITICVGHASASAWQGYRILEKDRLRAYLKSALSRAILVIVTVLSVFEPLTLLLIAPIVLISWFPAQELWLPSGMTPAAKQAYRRTLRQSDVHQSRADSRIKGKIVESDE